MDTIEIRPLAYGKFRVVVGETSTGAIDSGEVLAVIAALVTPNRMEERKALTLFKEEE